MQSGVDPHHPRPNSRRPHVLVGSLHRVGSITSLSAAGVFSFSFGKSAPLAPVCGAVRKLHYVGGVLTPAQQVRYGFHGPIDALEEGLVPGTEIIQAILPIRRAQKAIARALAVTREPDIAFPAIAWKGIAFGGLRPCHGSSPGRKSETRSLLAGDACCPPDAGVRDRSANEPPEPPGVSGFGGISAMRSSS
jgi:hypothetical protein